MRIREKTTTAVSTWIGFLTRQPHDWMITATRTSIYRFFYQMVLPYLSIYTLSLGASGLQLGLVNSIGIGVAGILGPLTGCVIDRVGYKVIYLVGISMLAVSWFLYAIAQSWEIIIVGMLAYWVGFGTSMHSCSVICGSALSNKDRATAMSVCESLAAGLLGMLGPMVGAFLVIRFGGVNVEGIRPLFYICLVGTICTFFFVLIKLPAPTRIISAKQSPNLFKGLSEVFAYRRSVKRFLAISSIVFLPQGMVIPFAQAFAREVKGADPYTLGAMVTGFALTPFLLGIPIGRIADRFGRKRVLLSIAPFAWASILILIWAPSSAFLILSGALQGFIYINSIITMAMIFELFPSEYMGRWMGINRFFRMSLAAVSAYAAGFIWDTIGPAYLFIAFIGVDLLIRIPLLISVPETKELKH
ncbi:MAG TPA: MFS transporter [Deltaproteobacteria bacterium]|nr:MFS transporter [Deltaproteobacteria bacterium]